ncbi:zinc ribbon domain-containing protein [Candidatus Aerophobetes bacterium]|nr:zinc ribbon domain-containing protein [Candidatus Aerophobetes bacterium]
MYFLLIGLIVPLLVAVWVASDAKKRGYSSAAITGWFAGVFLLLIVFLPLYLILRSRRPYYLKKNEATRLCPFCGKLFKEYVNFCPYCGKKLR